MGQSFVEVTGDGQRARDAAIAAMGQRLAAAGPRTRHRVTQRYNPALAEDAEPDEPVPPPPARVAALVADRSQAFVRDVAPILPPSPRRRALSVAGRTAGLAAMASAGFAVVLLAQSPRWSAAHRPAMRKPAADVAAAQIQPVAQADAQPARIAKNAAVAPPAATPAPAEPAAASTAPPPTAVEKPVAMPPKTPPPAPISQPSAAPVRPSRPMPVQLAASAPPRAPLQVPVRVAVRQAAIRPTTKHPLVYAKYTLPRWLTEAHETPVRPVIMSPPPHNLEAPAQAAPRSVAPAPAPQVASSAPPEAPRSLLPPLPRPRLIFASAGYMPPAPYRGPYGGYYGPAYPPAPYGYYQRQPYAP